MLTKSEQWAMLSSDTMTRNGETIHANWKHPLDVVLTVNCSTVCASGGLQVLEVEIEASGNETLIAHILTLSDVSVRRLEIFVPHI